MSWETIAGIISAEVKGDVAKIKLMDPSAVETEIKIDADGQKFTLDSINTGVPHAVVFVDDLDNCDVYTIGRKIRYHEKFAPAEQTPISPPLSTGIKSKCELTNAAWKMKHWPAALESWRPP